jgi:magnesium transporter
MSLEKITHNNVTWIDIEKATVEDINYLKKTYDFHPLALEDCLSRIERSKIDEHEGHLFIVMHFPLFDPVHRISHPSEVDIFIGRGYLVTVHDGVLKPLVNFYKTCQSDQATRERYMNQGSSVLMHTIVDRLVDYMFPILYKVDGHITHIEDTIFTADARHLVQEISIIRRDMIALRRIIRPQIEIIADLEQKDWPFIREEMEEYFGDILDHIRKVRDILEDHHEVIVALSQTVDSLMSHRINEIMRTLTVISVIMLPLTLISGIYGMNINLPFEQYPYAFALIMGGMICILTLMLLYFRHRNWL